MKTKRKGISQMRKIVLFLLCLILIIPNSIAYANSYFYKNTEEESIKNIN